MPIWHLQMKVFKKITVIVKKLNTNKQYHADSYMTYNIFYFNTEYSDIQKFLNDSFYTVAIG